jgi:hypothetical protein
MMAPSVGHCGFCADPGMACRYSCRQEWGMKPHTGRLHIRPPGRARQRGSYLKMTSLKFQTTNARKSAKEPALISSRRRFERG